MPFVNASPADHLPSIEGGRVAAELREADSFAGLFPCRPDGRFGAFRGSSTRMKTLRFSFTPGIANKVLSHSLDAVTFDILTACLKNFFSVPSV